MIDVLKYFGLIMIKRGVIEKNPCTHTINTPFYYNKYIRYLSDFLSMNLTGWIWIQHKRSVSQRSHHFTPIGKTGIMKSPSYKIPSHISYLHFTILFLFRDVSMFLNHNNDLIHPFLQPVSRNMSPHLYFSQYSRWLFFYRVSPNHNGLLPCHNWDR